MPGSLLIGNDSYSDVSESSNRSFDSKIGGKKVSFNKSVRVKQYPWKPDPDVSTSEHLTLPSNRFWFKVYKNKNENFATNNYDTGTPLQSTEEENNMDCIHNSLSPIAEVEDQDIVGIHTNGNSSEINCLESHEYEPNYNDYGNSHHYPTEPPVDYFHDLRLSTNRDLNDVKQVWRSDGASYHRFDFNNDYVNNYNELNANDTAHQHGNLNETGNDFEEISLNSNVLLNRLHRTYLKNEFLPRRSMRRFDDTNVSQPRERRSRSHDDHTDNDKRCKFLRKTDKSVSTDDLNFGVSPSNRFFKGSKDVATQCYGTLTRTNNTSTLKNNSLPLCQTFSPINTTERLKKFKSPRPSVLFKDTTITNSTINQKKDYSLEKFSNRNHAGENFLSKYSPLKKQNYGQQTENVSLNNDGYSRPLTRTETNIVNIIKRRAAETFSSRKDTNSISPVLRETKKSLTNRNNNIRDSNTVGYLRGKQIPLSEVNTNTNRKYLSRNNIGCSQRLHKDNENTSFFSESSAKPTNNISNRNQPKRYVSSINNSDRRNNLNSGKSCNSVFSEGNSSRIDWSLSGFQLASKPENLVTSMSDSEYTVHRRPPLLMYIPGVSHHDRPAIEDDRLSALSDVSRSELRDDSEFANSSTDFHRRQSLREGKSKWMKWRSKS